MNDTAKIPLRAWRDATGKNLSALSHESGIAARNLRNIERGTAKPHAKTLVRLAAAFNVTLFELFAGPPSIHPTE